MAGRIVLVDSATAMTLAQVLPLLLLTFAVELRRTRRHRGLSRFRLSLSDPALDSDDEP